ncbi:YjbH domain-containing protein [Polaromonas sp.]|uniref:YjbH domain-containing protein n=1 Tax=Polaromonas sp. TaxID=1869339 RepID=UPI00179954D3|nr:YjbH domain-containing protein [Polaromonas sp.]NMM05987.1 YjbH domain-containing protein [Polaromonas sp.]
MSAGLYPRRPPAARWATTVLGLALCQVTAVQAQGLGVASLGATGGLTIPSAYVLGSGDLALSLGNYQDPKFGKLDRQRNFSMGIGLLPRVELFGRFAEYSNRFAISPGAFNLTGGISDISANLKWQLPIELRGLPRLAVGATDIGGGAVLFSSKYAVASDEYGPLRWSLGYARGKPALGQAKGAKALDGVFGGAEFKLGSSRATLLAETDGTQRHAGLRYYSEVLPWLGDAQLVGTLQRSFGATNLAGRAADATSFNVSLIVPLGTADKTRQARVDADAKPLPSLAPMVQAGAAPATGVMVATAQDRLDDLARALRATGLDRVRVGTLGDQLVVEYENHRYLHNEADALGVVLGLAAEYAPAGTVRAHAITRKAGLVVSETSVEVAAYRSFLRDGDAARVQDTLGFGRLPGYAAVQWAAGEAGAGRRRTWLRMELKPLLNYTLGTEYGAFDYSLAAQVRSTVGLWKGAEVYADVVQRLAHSDNVEPGRVFASSLHRNGLKTVALQQSFWLGPRLFTSVGAGRYNYDDRGAEGESIMFLPWNDDTLHLKGSYMRHQADVLPRIEEAYAASYRWRFNPQTWIEAGYQQYTDRSTGPALTFTRWFSDVAVQLFARKGGNNTFVGLELSLPLGPRQAMGAGPLQITGTPRYAQSIRTRLTTGGNTGNFVDDAAVRPVNLNYKPEVELLNSGRIAPDYIKSQVQRMRESFYLYAREKIN